jgi:hypothetical protein
MTQTATALSPWAPASTKTPDLNMVATFYGVRVDDIGEDGDAFALGHVGRYRALAVFLRHSRENRGDNLTHAWTFDRAVNRVEYLWMVNLGTDDLWLLRQAEPTTPGAFPVTWWDA